MSGPDSGKSSTGDVSSVQSLMDETDKRILEQFADGEDRLPAIVLRLQLSPEDLRFRIRKLAMKYGVVIDRLNRPEDMRLTILGIISHAIQRGDVYISARLQEKFERIGTHALV